MWTPITIDLFDCSLILFDSYSVSEIITQVPDGHIDVSANSAHGAEINITDSHISASAKVKSNIPCWVYLYSPESVWLPYFNINVKN